MPRCGNWAPSSSLLFEFGIGHCELGVVNGVSWSWNLTLGVSAFTSNEYTFLSTLINEIWWKDWSKIWFERGRDGWITRREKTRLFSSMDGSKNSWSYLPSRQAVHDVVTKIEQSSTKGKQLSYCKSERKGIDAQAWYELQISSCPSHEIITH